MALTAHFQAHEGLLCRLLGKWLRTRTCLWGPLRVSEELSRPSACFSGFHPLFFFSKYLRVKKEDYEEKNHISFPSCERAVPESLGIPRHGVWAPSPSAGKAGQSPLLGGAAASTPGARAPERGGTPLSHTPTADSSRQQTPQINSPHLSVSTSLAGLPEQTPPAVYSCPFSLSFFTVFQTLTSRLPCREANQAGQLPLHPLKIWDRMTRCGSQRRIPRREAHHRFS